MIPGRKRPAATLWLASALIPFASAGTACGPGPSARTAAPLEAARAAPPSRPSEGEFRLDVAEGRITLRANAVRRSDVLAALAEEAGLQLAGGPAPPRILRVERFEGGLPDALALLLDDVRFRIEFEPDPALETARVALVTLETLASQPTPHGATAPANVGGRRATAHSRPEPPAAPREPPSLPTEGPRGIPSSELDAGLGDRDPEIRARAAAHVSPEGPGVQVLAAILAEDANAQVRAAAASQLALTRSALGIGSLLVALEDPAPEVIVAALGSLEFAGDATILHEIEPLLFHRDADVREAAATAIEMLR